MCGYFLDEMEKKIWKDGKKLKGHNIRDRLLELHIIHIRQYFLIFSFLCGGDCHNIFVVCTFFFFYFIFFDFNRRNNGTKLRQFSYVQNMRNEKRFSLRFLLHISCFIRSVIAVVCTIMILLHIITGENIFFGKQ